MHSAKVSILQSAGLFSQVGPNTASDIPIRRVSMFPGNFHMKMTGMPVDSLSGCKLPTDLGIAWGGPGKRRIVWVVKDSMVFLGVNKGVEFEVSVEHPRLFRMGGPPSFPGKLLARTFRLWQIGHDQMINIVLTFILRSSLLAAHLAIQCYLRVPVLMRFKARLGLMTILTSQEI